ncbi:MAG TPA: hydroxyisourate hydrolase [Bacteroidia bacterium]|jgi:5-hydroxyisourate hydrolase|nr:hydroxyisourate hydrolase [Bacteroidia bacterium]
MSQITTHILDTSKGKPAQGVHAVLEKPASDGKWQALGKGITNADGRITDLLAPDSKLEPGIYRLVFDTGAYFKKLGTACFYPSVCIVFETSDQSHYHVPLLLNPYGYSTYRGS